MSIKYELARSFIVELEVWTDRRTEYRFMELPLSRWRLRCCEQSRWKDPRTPPTPRSQGQRAGHEATKCDSERDWYMSYSYSHTSSLLFFLLRNRFSERRLSCPLMINHASSKTNIKIRQYHNIA